MISQQVITSALFINTFTLNFYPTQALHPAAWSIGALIYLHFHYINLLLKNYYEIVKFNSINLKEIIDPIWTSATIDQAAGCKACVG